MISASPWHPAGTTRRGASPTDAPDLVLLALRFAEQDGLEILREIRSRSNVPVLITGGCDSRDIDGVVGLELGADGYVPKPFGLRELLARIRAILRRQDVTRPAAPTPAETGRYRFGGWQLDRRTRRLTGADGHPITLTKSEHALLVAFLDAPQRPLTREYLLRATRVHDDNFDRSIDVQILRLRRKLEIDPSNPKVIRTERGIGYLFDLRSNGSIHGKVMERRRGIAGPIFHVGRFRGRVRSRHPSRTRIKRR